MVKHIVVALEGESVNRRRKELELWVLASGLSETLYSFVYLLLLLQLGYFEVGQFFYKSNSFPIFKKSQKY